MRYAYIKPNNVVQEIQRVLSRSGRPAQGGPDAYVAHFLEIAGENPTLLISTHLGPSDGDEFLGKDNITAKSYFWYSRRLKRLGDLAKHPVGTLLVRVVAATKIFVAVVRFRPDRVLCWGYSLPLLAAYAAAVVRQARFVYCSHGYHSEEKKRWYQRLTGKVDRWIMRRASAVIVHGPYLKQQMISAGIDPERIREFNWSFRHLVDQEGSGHVGGLNGIDLSKACVILFVGRVDRSKGVFELLEAVADQLRNDPGLRLIYAGDGTALDSLRRKVEEQGLRDRVITLGRLPHDALPALIRQSRLVVTPTQSWYPEGRCMAALEGLVLGRPVVAPNFGPFPFVVEHGVNGLLFQPDSVPDLRKKILELLYDEELHKRLSAGAARSRADILSSHVNFGQVVREVFLSCDGRSERGKDQYEDGSSLKKDTARKLKEKRAN